MPLETSCACGHKIHADERDAGREVRCTACGRWCTLPEPLLIAAPTGDEFARIHERAALNPRPAPVPSEEWADISRNATDTFPDERPRQPSANLAYSETPFKPALTGTARIAIFAGLGLMATAACWLIGCLVTQSLSYYPPIIFIAGLFSFLKGVFDINLADQTSLPSTNAESPNSK